MATNQPDRDRPPERDDVEGPSAGSTADKRYRRSDEREATAAGRELGADDRERIADDRERDADDRERVANDRDSVADDREGRADDRGGSDMLVEEHAASAGLRRDQSVERDAALLERTRASAARDGAETGRSVDASGRAHRFEEAFAVGAHLALNSSAIVVMGIGALKTHWPHMSEADRASIVDRVHHHAHVVDKTLRRYIAGGPA